MRVYNIETYEPAYARYNLPAMDRKELVLRFDLLFGFDRTADVSIVEIHNSYRPLLQVWLEPDNTLSVLGWHNMLYPSPDIYPSSTLYPGGDVYTPRYVAMYRVGADCHLELTVRNPGLYTDIDLYIESANRYDSTSINLLNWFGDLTAVDVGCVTNNGTFYDYWIDTLMLEGDKEGEWYNISEYHGFRTDVLWQATNELDLPAMYTDYTDLRKLSRFDYARPETTPIEAKGLKWRRLST